MKHIAIIGGGVSGMAAAIAAAEQDPSARITILERIFCDPASHDHVIHIDHQRTDVGDPACRAPFFTDARKGGDSVLAGMTADCGFHLNHGVPHQSDHNNIDDQENAAAALICKIREAPDISKTNGCTGSYHKITET